MRKSKLLVSTIILLVILMLGTLLTGCGGKTFTESDISYAGPMLDNVLAGIKDKNYDEFSKDFSDTMKNALTKESFDSLVTMFDSKIGEYTEKTFAGATETTQNNKTYTVVVYKAKYTKETGDVQITVTFSDNNGKKLLEGLVFNSPNLQKK